MREFDDNLTIRSGGAITALTTALSMAGAALLFSNIAEAQAPQELPDFAGMWSDPPFTAADTFCLFFCSDEGVDYLNALLDDPDNDDRPYQQLLMEASIYQRDHYIRPLLTDAALADFPWDPAKDPGFLECEPWGFTRQIFAGHQLQITQFADRIEMHYGEWDGRRTIYLDGRERNENEPGSKFGLSIGHYEGDTLVVETTGISANRTLWRSHHSDQLRTVERYSRDYEGDRLLLSVVMEDPWGLKEPLRMNKIWRWAPEEEIFPYADCQPPENPSALVTEP